MYYTVKDVAKRTGLTSYTIRYYAKEGLLPNVEKNENGVRMFHDDDFEWFNMLECLKKTGMSIKDIKRFLQLVEQGESTIEERLKIFQEQKKKVLQQINELEKTLNVLDYKCWYYETAKEKGSTKGMENLTKDDIPIELRCGKDRLMR